MGDLSGLDSSYNIDLVIKVANDFYSENEVLAALTACQAILEGGLRSTPPSKLALIYNNLFGIKGTGTGLVVEDKRINTVTLQTHEFYSGEMHEVDQRFAVNGSLKDSFMQHDKLLHLPRYKQVLESKNITEAATSIWKAGYATDPHYPDELIAIYNNYCLNA